MTLRQTSCALLLLLACGSKDGIDSGLPEDKTGEELMPAEQQTLCEAAGEYLDANISDAEWTGYLCTLESFGAGDATDTAGLIAACKEARQACIAAGGQEQIESVCSDVDDWTMCDATVGEIEACLEGAIDLLGGIIRDFTCDALDPAKAMALQEKYGDSFDDPFPASCDVVKAKCPAILGMGEEPEPEPEPI